MMNLRRLVAVAALFFALALAYAKIAPPGGSTTSFPGIIISPSGNDTNPGTVASPIATLTQCHRMMQAQTAGQKTACFLRSGSYTVSTWTMGSNETYSTYPGDPPQSAVITFTADQFGCWGCINLVFRNLSFINTTVSRNGRLFAFFPSANGIQAGAERNISFINNNFNVTVETAIQIYNTDNVYIVGNTFTNGTTDNYNTIGLTYDDSVAHTNVYIVDNTFINAYRFFVEIMSQPGNTPDALNIGGQVQSVHVDRNTFSGALGNQPGISVVGVAITGGSGQNTIAGNMFTNLSVVNNAAIEVGLPGTTTEFNWIHGWNWGIMQAACPGCVTDLNTVDIPATGSKNVISPDGGYTPGTGEWVGINYANDANGVHAVLGCQGIAVGAITGGTGGTDGTYANQAVTGGSGIGMFATFTVSGGATTAITITHLLGTGYTMADTLSSAFTGAPTGFSFKLANTTAGRNNPPGYCALGYNSWAATRPPVSPASRAIISSNGSTLP